ncbi:MAG: retention module-containing protein, partial [Oceanospirillaceae bacterium]
MTVIGKVSLVIGKVVAIDGLGNERILTIGDDIFEGERVVASSGSKVALQMTSGDQIAIEDGQSWTPTSETYSVAEDFPVEDSVINADDLSSVESIQQALLAGADPTESAEATAAGAGNSATASGEANDGGGSFVTLERTAGEVDPTAGYDTIGTSTGISTGQQDVPELLIFTPPTIVVIDSDGGVTAADNSAIEGTGDTVFGSFTALAEAGVQSLTINGQSIVTPISIVGTEGTLNVISFNPATGLVNYSYSEDGDAELHNQANDNINDQFTISLVDNAGQTTSNSLDIQIIDTVPVAQDDATQ